MEVTRIQKEDLNAYAVSNKTAKIITGKEKCALVAIDRSKGDSLEDHLKMDDLIENEDYIPLFRDNLNGKSAMCYLFLQSEYLTNNNRENEKRLRVLDDKCKIDYDIGIVAIVGDRLREATGIAGSVFGSLGNRKIKTLANLATPYSSKILALVKENEVPDAVRAVYWGVTR
jgi:aspartokinase